MLEIITNFCLFYNIPITDYERVLDMSYKKFFAFLDYKNKVLRAEGEALKNWQHKTK